MIIILLYIYIFIISLCVVVINLVVSRSSSSCVFYAQRRATLKYDNGDFGAHAPLHIIIACSTTVLTASTNIMT